MKSGTSMHTHSQQTLFRGTLMQHINQLTASISQNAHKQTAMQPTSTHNSQQSEQLEKENIASLFKGWKKLFRSKMKDEDWDLDTVIVWHIALNDLGITADEFHAAKRKSLGLQWPPTAPADFLALGRIETASPYPTANAAFMTACQNCGMKGDIERDWKHEVVYETANRIGWGKLASATEYFFKTFKQVYEQVVIEHKAGKTFVIPQSHQVAYEHTPVQAGSEADKRITAELEKLRRVAV